MLGDLKQKLQGRQKVFATTITHAGWSGIIQRMKNDTIDILVFDLEHGLFTSERAEEMIRMCNVVGIPAIVRVADAEYAFISSALDMGADGILAPRVETVDQARRVVDSVRFPPVGKKGCGGFSLLRGGDALSSVKSFNEARIIFLQIESERGIANLGDMIDAAEGQLGGIIVGPTDLSISMSIPLQYGHPRLVDAIGEVLRVCQREQISCGLFCGDKEDISYWRRKGMNIIWAGTDVGFLLSAYNDLCGFVQGLA